MEIYVVLMADSLEMRYFIAKIVFRISVQKIYKDCQIVKSFLPEQGRSA